MNYEYEWNIKWIRIYKWNWNIILEGTCGILHENLDNAKKNLVENFMRDETAHEILENDMTDSWKIHSRGAVLYSLNAVTKLGMFMTGPTC